MQYRFSDIFLMPSVQELLTSFQSKWGTRAEIVNLDGEVIVASSDQNSFEKSQSRGSHLALLDWERDNKYRPQHNKKYSRRYKCFNRIFKYVRDIRVENQTVATLNLGPVFHKEPNDDLVRGLAREFDYDSRFHQEVVREIPIISERQIEGYTEFLAPVIQHLVGKGITELHLKEEIAVMQERQKNLEQASDELKLRIQARTEELEKANDAFQESEQRFRVALVDTPIVVFNQDIDLRYTWIYNPQNYANQPIIGKTDLDLFSEEDAKHLIALKRRVIRTGLLTREEVSMTVGSKTSFYDMTLDPLYDAGGKVTGLTCAATDITERKQIEKELRRRLVESEGIQKIAKGLLQKIGLDEVLEIVCTEAMQLTGAEGSAVLLLDEERWLRLTHRAGLPVYTLDRLPMDGSFGGRAVRTGRPVWVNRQESTPDEEADLWQGYPWTPGLLSMLSVPLKVDMEPIGVLNILNKPGEITQEDIRIIDLFADQAAIIIEHVRLQHKAEQLAVLTERQRLARELHDSVTQALYSVTLYADAVHMAFSRKQWGALESNLQEVRNMAREAMYDMRLLVFELRPYVLEKEGIASALRNRLSAVEGRAGLKTELFVDGERRLPIVIEEEIYRIAQEGLNNVVKHAKAREVQIHLKYDQDTVRLEMIDNGLGFDSEIASQSGGLGLRGVRERVHRLGGKLEIKSATGRGTCLAVNIPIGEFEVSKLDE